MFPEIDSREPWVWAREPENAQAGVLYIVASTFSVYKTVTQTHPNTHVLTESGHVRARTSEPERETHKHTHTHNNNNRTHTHAYAHTTRARSHAHMQVDFCV